MKKIYILSMLLFATIAKAQPTFTNGDFFNLGSSDSFKMGVTTYAYAFGMAVEHNTSASHTWDFVPDIVYLTGAFNYSCTTPTPSSYTYFPVGSNLRESCNGGSIENLYEKLSDTVYMMRSGTNLSSGSFMVPKLRWITFPLHLGDSLGSRKLIYMDTAKTIPGFTRTHSYMYDGFGTVKLPWGNYPNVFRIKMITRDSSHILTNYVTTYSNYLFFEQGGGVPIARLTSSCTADSVSHAYTLIANRTKAVPNAVNNIAGITTGIQLFPNPAKDKLFISNGLNIVIRVIITDMLGRKQDEKTTTDGLSDMSLTGLVSGSYVVTVYGDQGQIICRERIVKAD